MGDVRGVVVSLCDGSGGGVLFPIKRIVVSACGIGADVVIDHFVFVLVTDDTVVVAGLSPKWDMR